MLERIAFFLKNILMDVRSCRVSIIILLLYFVTRFRLILYFMNIPLCLSIGTIVNLCWLLKIIGKIEYRCSQSTRRIL